MTHEALAVAAICVNDRINDPSPWILGQIIDRGIAGAVVLHTCQRSEVYVAPGDVDACVGTLVCNRGVVSPLTIHLGMEAARHLMRVACGLESTVLGEHEILGQVRLAYRQALEDRRCLGFLDKVVQRSLKAAKRARTETKISKGAMSLVAAIRAVLAAKDGNVQSLAVVGAGYIGQKVCRMFAATRRPPSIHIVNRTYERARALAEEIIAQPHHWEEALNVIRRSDAAIIALGGGMINLDSAGYGRCRIIVDVSEPRCMSSVNEPADTVIVIPLSEVEEWMRRTSFSRVSEIPRVETIIEEELEELVEWSVRQTLYTKAAAVHVW